MPSASLDDSVRRVEPSPARDINARPEFRTSVCHRYGGPNVQLTAYCYYVRFRSRAVERRVFSTAEDRRIALRTLAREQVDDVSDEATAVELVDLLRNLGVSVDVFEGS